METSIPMNSEFQSDEHWMRFALAEARKVLGATNPNPVAGAVTNAEGQTRHGKHGILNRDEF
jgi:pyrimidine deaminase RibD-like protein